MVPCQRIGPVLDSMFAFVANVVLMINQVVLRRQCRARGCRLGRQEFKKRSPWGLSSSYVYLRGMGAVVLQRALSSFTGFSRGRSAREKNVDGKSSFGLNKILVLSPVMSCLAEDSENRQMLSSLGKIRFAFGCRGVWLLGERREKKDRILMGNVRKKAFALSPALALSLAPWQSCATSGAFCFPKQHPPKKILGVA